MKKKRSGEKKVSGPHRPSLSLWTAGSTGPEERKEGKLWFVFPERCRAVPHLQSSLQWVISYKKEFYSYKMMHSTLCMCQKDRTAGPSFRKLFGCSSLWYFQFKVVPTRCYWAPREFKVPLRCLFVFFLMCIVSANQDKAGMLSLEVPCVHGGPRP